LLNDDTVSVEKYGKIIMKLQHKKFSQKKVSDLPESKTVKNGILNMSL
jgi:hypothetical protein